MDGCLRLVDMHCHVDFMANATEVAEDALHAGLGVFAVTVSPRGFERASGLLGSCENMRVGVGLHPWWLADGRCGIEDVERAALLARNSRYVGEIGLDFSSKHVSEASREMQLAAFDRIARACAEGAEETGGKVLSIHSVRSASTVLDLLEETGCLNSCACVFHWFSGSSDELHRAVRAGCWFSINEMMLSTRRGREYARQLPVDRLLLETDLPPGEGVPFAAEGIVSSLERTLGQLRDIRGADLRAASTENACALLEL